MGTQFNVSGTMEQARTVESSTYSRLAPLLVFCAVMALSAWYVGSHLLTGWVPADDGFLAQGALRVLQGQLPHRDFAEIYTGGLNYIHAAAFRFFGISLVSLRIAVFLFFLAWVPAVYYICRQFVSPVVAGGATLLAVAWSFPNYPAAMPSWYNLFFATFGAAALIHYIKKRSMWALFIAGVCGGVSVLIKVIGVYYIAGVLLFFVFVEQSDDQGREKRGSWIYRGFIVACLLLYLCVLCAVIGARLSSSEFYHFVLPSLALVVLLLTREVRTLQASSLQRFLRLSKLIGPFLAGVLLPIVVFLIPYIASDSVHALLGGTSGSALGHASALAITRPLAIEYSIYSVLVIGILVTAMYWEKTRPGAVGLSFFLALTLIGAISNHYWIVFSRLWFSMALIVPLTVLLGIIILLKREKLSDLSEDGSRRLMLLVSLAATCSLVQFPFPVPIYFCYSAPLTLLALVAIVNAREKLPGKLIILGLLVFYLWYGVFKLVPSYIYELTHVVGKAQVLHIERGGIRTENAESAREFYEFLKQHSPNGLIYAGTNCPHVYFLTGLKNPTRDDGGAPPEEILKAIDHGGLRIVVINEAPMFPTGITGPELRAELAKRLPNTKRFGGFTVMWRE